MIGRVQIRPTPGVTATDEPVAGADLAAADAAMAARARGPWPFPADVRLAAPPVPVLAARDDDVGHPAVEQVLRRCRELGWVVQSAAPAADALLAATDVETPGADTCALGWSGGAVLRAPAHRDAVLMDLARRLVGAATTDPAWPEAVADIVELVVFGAHLRGQPLDHELTGRGARWCGEVRTAPGYRLVALDTDPPKPGLVPGGHRSVRGEKWVLSQAALGSFLADLPAPMTLGALTLDDGARAVGFSCTPDAAAAGRPLDVDHWLERAEPSRTPR